MFRCLLLWGWTCFCPLEQAVTGVWCGENPRWFYFCSHLLFNFKSLKQYYFHWNSGARHQGPSRLQGGHVPSAEAALWMAASRARRSCRAPGLPAAPCLGNRCTPSSLTWNIPAWEPLCSPASLGLLLLGAALVFKVLVTSASRSFQAQ